MTNGHLDIITRAAALVDELVVAVLSNPSKSPLFTNQERVELLAQSLNNLPNVKVEGFSGLLVNFVKQRGARIIFKGLRALSDFEYEFQMALMNRTLASEVETVFLMTSGPYAFLSSSMVREVASMGGDVGGLVPRAVEAQLTQRFGAGKFAPGT